MSGCCGFDAAIRQQFTERSAAKEMQRYLKRGPNPTTALLRDDLIRAGLVRSRVLDVGAGIGALTFELLDRGLAHSVAVDASPAYIAAATAESERRNSRRSTTFVLGDFVEIAHELPQADTVVLDRVVCCYPDYEPLLDQALRHAAAGLAFSYPKDRWFVKLVVWIENAFRALRSNPFRVVIHPLPEMLRLIQEAGFDLVSRSQTIAWSVDVYRRTALT
jgi:magnesium-protoporphyrin O-methyltransferase